MQRITFLAVLGALLALPLVATIHQAWAGPALHDEPVGVAAPAIVTEALADSAASLDGTPFDVVPLADTADHDAAYDAARRDVADGLVDAAVVLDLRTTTDVLLVTDTRTDAYVDALLSRLTPISEGYGRTLEVQRIEPADAVGSASSAGVLTACSCAVGIVLAAGISVTRGPVSSTRAGGLVRLLVVITTAAVTGIVSAALVGPGTSATSWALVSVAAATVTVTALLILAAESVLGVGGLVIAVALMIGPALPLLSGVTPDLLAEPWHTLAQVSPQTAGWRMSRTALGHTDGAAGSWALMTAWAAIGSLTLLTAGWLRPEQTAQEPAEHAIDG